MSKAPNADRIVAAPPAPPYLHIEIGSHVRRPAADDIRAEILQAAANTFIERGFARASIDDVAQMLGATKGRIYHYYQSKADIIVDIHLESLRLLLESVGAIAARSDLAPAERLYRMCYAHALNLLTNPAYHKATAMGLGQTLVSFRAREPTEGTEQIKTLRRTYEQLFVDTLADGVALGMFRCVAAGMLAKPLLGALNWTNLWYRPSADADRCHELAHGLAAFCVKAVLARGPLPRRMDQP